MDLKCRYCGDCAVGQSESYALAMAYVPWQELGNVFSPLDALKNGTLFPELYKPFCGRTIAS